MKYINQLLLLSVLVMFVMTSCDKVDDLSYYNNGKPITLSASSSSIAPAPADSTNNVVTFSWSSPEYATDTSTYKFILEIDSAGRNFSKKV